MEDSGAISTVGSKSRWTHEDLNIPIFQNIRRPLGADLGKYFKKWVPISIVIGILAGLGAIIFQILLDAIWDISYSSFAIPWYLIIFIPAIGGLSAGIIIKKWAPEAAGSGTDNIIDSVHHHGSKVRGRVVPVKIVSSALTIGSGGSAGNEGPSSPRYRGASLLSWAASSS